jgi:hypothetical protein
MALNGIVSDFRSRLSTLGEIGLNALFPQDFEFYMVALELVNSRGNTEEYFSFPVLPSNIREQSTEITNIKKTAGGIVVIDNDSFVTKDITMSGTFGRNFKLLVNGGGDRIEFAGISLSFSGGRPDLAIERPDFSRIAKTGYGCTKILEKIKNKSVMLDNNGKPYSLYLYNPVLGNNYVVKFIDIITSQSEDVNNRIPKYEITLRAIASLDSIGQGGAVDLVRNTSASAIQKSLNNGLNGVRRSFRL